MQVVLADVKLSFEKFIFSEGRHWKSKVKALVDDAFYAYDGQVDYLRKVWDDFGIDDLAIQIYDKLDQESSGSQKDISNYLSALEKLSSYIRAEYLTYKDVPDLLEFQEEPADNSFAKTEHNTSVESNLLLDYCKNIVIQYSYKPVLIKAICKLSNNGNVIGIDDLLLYFEQFYSRMYLKYGVAEKSNSIFSKLTHSKIFASSLLRTNPIAILEKANIIQLSKDGFSIVVSDVIMEEIPRNRSEICKLCDSVLSEYYLKLTKVVDNRYSIFEHTNPWGRKKCGITRSECRDRNGQADQCIIVKQGMTLDEAREEIANYEYGVERLDYFDHPLHILMLSKDGRLINAFDSIKEASCILGMKPATIKSFCRGEAESPKYNWAYGETFVFSYV